MIHLQQIPPQLQIVRSGLILWLDASIQTSYTGSGTTWRDLSSNSNTGSLTNGPTYSTNNGGYITTDGSNNFITVASSSSLETGTSRTVSIWCRPQTVATSIVLCKLFTGPGGDYYILIITDKWSSRSDGGTGVITDTATIVANTWYFLTLTFQSNSSLKFYVNNNYIGEDTSPGPLRSDGQSLNIGTFVAANSHFHGDIGSVLIYNTILTAEQITHNYNITKKRFGL